MVDVIEKHVPEHTLSSQAQVAVFFCSCGKTVFAPQNKS